MHPLQELQEAEEAEEEAEEEVEEAEEVEEEEAEVEEAGEQTPLPCLASDSVETPPKYSQEKEKKQTAFSPNSNAITEPISESQSSTPGSEKSSLPAPISKDPSSTNGSTEPWTGSRN